MKLTELLLESPTDLVARFYKEADADYDRYYNTDNADYKDKNQEFSKKQFKSWYDSGQTPVFSQPVETEQPAYNVTPASGKRQSPGYRGQQYAKARAGIPYDKTVEPYRTNPGLNLLRQAQDDFKNSVSGGY